eukprot:GGOE01023260.1.p1 GENE.GGOE01023260.1~~GGOE01023260.1.p1  ORF type:complete len:379 (-),score=25.41 GGOE01023260.1:567-1703(-)
MEEAARLLECYRIEGGPAPMAIGHAPATDCYGHAMNIMSQLMVEVQEREQQLVEAIHHGQNLLAELCRLKNPSPVRSPLRSTAPPATSTPSAVHSPPSLSPPSASQCGCLLLPLTSPSKRLLQSEMSRMTKAMQGKHVAVAEWARRCDDLARHLERSEAEKDGAVAMCQRLQDHLRRSEAERCELEAAISELEWSNAQLREEGCRLLAVLPVRDESPPSRSTCSVATWTDPASALQTAETTVSSSPLSSEESPHSLDTEMQLSSPQQPGSISPFSSAGSVTRQLLATEAVRCGGRGRGMPAGPPRCLSPRNSPAPCCVPSSSNAWQGSGNLNLWLCAGWTTAPQPFSDHKHWEGPEHGTYRPPCSAWRSSATVVHSRR